MRSGLIFILFFFFCSGLMSQYSILWETNIEGEFNDKINDMIVTDAGNYLIIGSTDSQSGFTSGDAYVGLMSSQGEVIWENSFGGTENDSAASGIEVSDGFIFVGTTNSIDGDLDNNILENVNIWLTKVDKNGQLIWSQTYGTDGGDRGFQIIETQDGGLAVLVYLSGSEFVVMQLSLEGNLENVYDIDLDHEGVNLGSVARMLAQDVNGDFIISGDYYDRNTFEYQSHWLYKMTKNGEKIWDSKMDAIQGCVIKSFISISEDFIVAGECDGDGWIMRTDSLGNIIWSNLIGGLGYEFINDFVVTEHGTFLGVGGSSSDNFGLDARNNNILLFEFSEDGELLWLDTFGDSLIEAAHTIMITPDNNYIIGAEHDWDMVVYKISLDPTATSSLDPTSTHQLYPNPVSDILTIKVAPSNLNSNYTILNTSGQTCVTGKLDSVNYEIDVRQLLAGKYNFVIHHEAKDIIMPFIKI